MRDPFRNELMTRVADPDLVVLTGDLGYSLFEPVQAAMGARFINAGVAEQNMVGVAAGMAKAGLFPWVYSIGPFLYARTYEQIRNDVVQHQLPVTLVGNGGGYGYGVMGSTHHSLEDYGILSTLRGLTTYVPTFDEDLAPIFAAIWERRAPTYLRLGRCERPKDFVVPPFAPWRRLLNGQAGVIVTVGPLAGSLVAEFSKLAEAARPELWVVTKLPFVAAEVPIELVDRIHSDELMVVEEHVQFGGVGSMLSMALLELGRAPSILRHHAARGYPSGRYGSQTFHRRESAIDSQSVRAALDEAHLL